MVKVGLHVWYTDHYPFDFEHAVLCWNTCQYHIHYWEMHLILYTIKCKKHVHLAISRKEVFLANNLYDITYNLL